MIFLIRTRMICWTCRLERKKEKKYLIWGAIRHGIWHKLYTVTISEYFFLPEKRVNHDKLYFATKQHKLYFQIINIHITPNYYIMGIPSTGLPMVSLWATKFATKRPWKCDKSIIFCKTAYVQTKIYPKRQNILHR